ncbi:DNA adenine methylase [Xanthomonas sp. WHRI 1810A]|uniref:DNA adenine methylase n=1 Tax=Xanthomonas sp. WHRI 1810A TaxID=3161565 RepID=UPI0032E8DD4C
MKYMGHKGKLLKVLGDVLLEESKNSSSIADPFCGSGAVSWFLAERTSKRVVSGDLQGFAACRAGAITHRTALLDHNKLLRSWLCKAETIVRDIVEKFPNAEESVEPRPSSTDETIKYVLRSRVFCERVLPPLLETTGLKFPITKAYGGHYFSPMQAIWLDALRATLPTRRDSRIVALAALIETAGKCAASPGHTAQPFQPTATSSRHILDAWSRSVEKILREATTNIASRSAQVLGESKVADFLQTIEVLEAGDTVFADPPYSDVHYSRFYHVLETLYHGLEIEVTGRGRYPCISVRPSSRFSLRAGSKGAALDLIETCSRKRLSLVLTFPSSGASNGLSAQDFIDAGKQMYSSIQQHEVDSDFSTLGGNAVTRDARLNCRESIICFRP